MDMQINNSVYAAKYASFSMALLETLLAGRKLGGDGKKTIR